MPEKDILSRMDRYFRREDTSLAKLIKSVAPAEGRLFRGQETNTRRVADVMIATPAAVATLPIMSLLAAAAKLEDGGSAFYIHKRIGKYEKPIEIIKVRCMRVNADNDIKGELLNTTLYGRENDPRNTRLGRFTRKYELEEIPQLWQVMRGDLSLVGIRASNQNTHNFIKETKPLDYESWREEYAIDKPGLFSLNSAVNPNRKDNSRRTHYDLLYARKASLGLNLYVLWKTGLRALRSLNKRS